MTDDELRRLVTEVVREVVQQRPAKGVEASAPADDGGASKRRGPRHRPLPAPRDAEALAALKASTPARIVTGRTGTRYLTSSYLGLRADHAIALDAVESEVPDGWAEQQGWLPLRTRAKDHAEFFLHPDLGRRLDDASKARCEKEADRGVDVQLLAGDGLSAYALLTNGPALVQALQRHLAGAGFRVGRPLFVRYARIGVQDEVGVLTQAKSTVIVVGERPGLGTGDSLSIYTAFGPKLGQDNAEKDCISNVRALGFAPERAAARCAALMRDTFAAGGGGVKLTGGDPAFRPHVVNH
ncbi:MAG: ethanolamine ammonia-lyase subunit EutC [Myxococcaceae bacterium]|jgi:ethanolamine ammonia-lyase small subunit|nr:ethanolamine ammonia-lyase subunit EutC [Myxococcaceae bacterium]MCA3016115.1 ethanolamine ammonia-lyase subunit EutC [Myxococcaceae bacterium]